MRWGESVDQDCQIKRLPPSYVIAIVVDREAFILVVLSPSQKKREKSC